VHQQHPFICVWDDHESANDSWVDGAENHDDVSEGSWSLRKGSSKRAYFEWMPIREQSLDSSIYRKIAYGDLLNLYMLDTRLEGRDEQVGATSSEINSTSRSLLGGQQLDWFKNELTASTAQWNIIGQQVMMAPLEAFGVVLNPDQWDGYNAERMDILNHIINTNIQNFVVLTGDIHTAWANDIPLNNYNSSTGANSAGVEFVVTSVTSPGFPVGFGTSLIQSFNPHMKWIDLTQHGYMILDINQNRTQSEWYFLDDITIPSEGEFLGNAFYVNSDERFIRQASLTSVGYLNCIAAPEFPWNPDIYVDLNERLDEFYTYGIYPNPFDDSFTIHLGSNSSEKLTIEMFDATGNMVLIQENVLLSMPSEYFKIYASELSSGVYFLHINSENSSKTHRLIKR
jgi:alkaline phosphatase D